MLFVNIYLYVWCMFKILKLNKKKYKKIIYKIFGRVYVCRVVCDIFVCVYLLFDVIYCCKLILVRYG